MTIEKVIIDKSQYGGRYNSAEVTMDVLMSEGTHYVFNFTAKAFCDGHGHGEMQHKDSCFERSIENTFGKMTGRLLMYERSMMEKLKQ